MQLAILHYHLNHGGVTQVIVNHLRALGCCRRPGWPERVAILYGGRRGGWPDTIFDGPPPFPVELIKVPALDYDERTAANPDGLAAQLQAALAE